MYTNIHIIGVPEEEERDKRGRDIFEEIITKNFPNLVKETIHPDQGNRVPNRINSKKTTPRCSVIKLVKIKDKERILEDQWKYN